MSNHSIKYFKLHGILDFVCLNYVLNDLKVANSILRDADNIQSFRICFMNIRQWSFYLGRRDKAHILRIREFHVVDLKDVTYIPYLSTETHGFIQGLMRSSTSVNFKV